MFTKTIKSTLIAVAITLGAVVSATGAANAEVRGGIYLEGPGISVGIGDRDRRYNRRHRQGDRWDRSDRRGRWDRRGGWGRGDRWDRPRHRACSPRKAVRKARRKGIRHAHVVRVGHRGVIVAGRKWGERVVIGFRNNRRCSVRFVRANY